MHKRCGVDKTYPAATLKKVSNVSVAEAFMCGILSGGRRIAVEIQPFFSQTFTDEEAKELNQRLHGRAANGKEPIPFSFEEFLRDTDRMVYTLGKTEWEKAGEIVLFLGAMENRVLGVARGELQRYFDARGSAVRERHIQYLVDEGYFREEFFFDTAVIFPTDKLFLQIVERRAEYRKMYVIE